MHGTAPLHLMILGLALRRSLRILACLFFSLLAVAQAPVINQHPQDQTVALGERATFTVQASGRLPSYQWYRNDQAVASGLFNRYLTPPVTAGDQGAQFKVRVSNPYGSIFSNPATLTVTGISGQAPEIQNFYASPSTITQGQFAQLSWMVSGATTLTLNGTALPSPTSGQRNVYPTSTTTFTLAATNAFGTVSAQTTVSVQAAALPVIQSFTANPETIVSGQSSTLSWNVTGATSIFCSAIGNVSETGSTTVYPTSTTTYTLSATSPAGTVSAQKTVTVQTAPVPTIQSFTAQPPSISAGQTSTLSWSVTGATSLNLSGIGTVTGTSRTVTPTATTTYTLSAYNAYGSSHASTSVTVSNGATTPSITQHPQSQAVAAGQAASFSVRANGTAPLTYQWTKNASPISGATSASYTTPATTTADHGAQFRATVSNSAGSVTSNPATLSVNASPAAPTITSHPQNQTVQVGQNATFTVVATGTPTPSYQWYRLSTAIPGAQASSYTLVNVQSSDHGARFRVYLNNALGGVWSNLASLNVTTSAVMPTITQHPQNQTVQVGQTASFSVAANGTAPLNYQWYRSGWAISGATSPTYTTPATTSSDHGSSFFAKVSNSAGTAQSSAATLSVTAAPTAPVIASFNASPASITVGQSSTLSWSVSGATILSISGIGSVSGTSTVVAPTSTTTYTLTASNAVGSVQAQATVMVGSQAIAPTITSHPQNQTVTAGQTASFSVGANGTAPLAYQWSKNASPISGATSASYTTPATTTADHGAQFRATVSNSAGNVTSNAATLSVNASAIAPTITSHPQNQTVTAGQTASFSVGANGTAPLAYQWSKNASPINGATSATYTTPATTTADHGAQFRATVSNSAGNVTSNAATLTVTAPQLGAMTWKRDIVYLGGKEVAEVSAEGIRITLTDHLGSPRVVLNPDGTVLQQKFMPFGESLTDPATAKKIAKGYTGHEQTDPNGLIYMQARFYVPWYHKFAAPDPGLDQKLEFTQKWNIYSYVSNNPVMSIDPDGMLERDKNGNIIFKKKGNGNAGHQGAPGTKWKVDVGVIKTNSGVEITAIKSKDADPRMDTNCHGLAYADGKYAIDDTQVKTLLKEDGYQKVEGTPQTGDVGVFTNKNGDVVHSVTVTGVDAKGNATEVSGLGGIEIKAHSDAPAAGPGGAWHDPNATLTYYRPPAGESEKAKQERVNRSKTYEKKREEAKK